jgi:hypothetical protein
VIDVQLKKIKKIKCANQHIRWLALTQQVKKEKEKKKKKAEKKDVINNVAIEAFVF